MVEVKVVYQLFDEPGGANLLAVGLLDPEHDVGAVGLHVVDRLLDGLLLMVAKLPMGLDADVRRQGGVLHLATNLLLKPEFTSLFSKSTAAVVPSTVMLVHVDRRYVRLSLGQVLGGRLPEALRRPPPLCIVLDHRPTSERDGGWWLPGSH